MNNNQNIFLKCLYTGLCPDPHFILCLETKNEARKFKPKRSPTRSAARQKFQAKRASLFTEISSLAAFTASAAPRFGRANARRIESASPQCVRSKKTKTLFRRFAVQTKATAGVRSNRQSSLVTFCDDRK
jgi:hypothetical protein